MLEIAVGFADNVMVYGLFIVLWLKSRNNTNATGRKKNSIKEQKLIACKGKYKNIKNFRFSKLMWTNILESQGLKKDFIGSGEY